MNGEKQTRPMLLGIDARAYDWTGIGRYVRNLLAQITRQARDVLRGSRVEFVVFVPARYAREVSELPHTRAVPVRDSHYSLYEQTGFLRRLLTTKADLLHFPNFNVPIGYRRPYVVTIHDLTRFHFPGQKHQGPLHQWIYTQVFRSAVYGAQAIVAVSEFTKSELVQRFPRLAQRTTVIFEGVDRRFTKARTADEDRTLQRLGISRPYLLYVGLWMKHKNLPGLVQAFRLVRDRGFRGYLVVTGEGRPWDEPVRRLAEEHGVAGALVTPGRVADSDLPALYRNAEVFVFPSFSEGFGLPPLEALACGTPVVAANAGSLPEVLGDAAVYAEPHDPRRIAEAILFLLSEQPFRAALAEKGRQRVANFSWETCGRQTLELYSRVLGCTGGERRVVPGLLHCVGKPTHDEAP